MAVLLETSLGDIVIDLYTNECPKTSLNFLKLCKIKYYNNIIFHNVQKDFIVQSGDPTSSGKGGESIYGKLYGKQARYFDDEINNELIHDKIGTVSMASGGKNLNASQFFITTAPNLDYLDGKHTIFGVVAEGFDVLAKINNAYCDDNNRPYQNIRIRHTIILDDPFPDPNGLEDIIPSSSPLPIYDTNEADRIEIDKEENNKRTEEEIEKSMKIEEAKSRAQVLEMLGDLPDADIKPPENVLFVCKLNQVTLDDDLELIFSRFGTIKNCEIIRDYKTGDSLQYAFIEFENVEDCERAYFKMDNALIDDRRIHVDFSQSVSKLWNAWKHGSKGIGAAFDSKGQLKLSGGLVLKKSAVEAVGHGLDLGRRAQRDQKQYEHIYDEKDNQRRNEYASKSHKYNDNHHRNSNRHHHHRSKDYDDHRKSHRKSYKSRSNEKDHHHHRRRRSKSRSNDRDHRRRRSKSRSNDRDHRRRRSKSRSNDRDHRRRRRSNDNDEEMKNRGRKHSSSHKKRKKHNRGSKSASPKRRRR